MKIVVIGHFAESLINIRGPLLAALVKAGHRVVACAPGGDKGVETRLEDLGASYESIDLDPAGVNPIRDFRFLVGLTKFLHIVRPDVVLNYSTKPVIYGSLAAQLAGVPRRFSMITGLGYVFSGDAFRQRLTSALVLQLYRLSLTQNKAVFFQNPDDLAFSVESGLVSDPKRAVLINGSGVDLDHFREVPPCTRRPVFLLTARLVKEKGILEYAQAARTVKRRHPQAVFHLLGPFSSSPSRIEKAQIESWEQEGIIRYLGEVEDVRPCTANASVFVLPSYYREGTPRATLEAMAMGRPIITSDTPGCRETVVDGKNGYLIPAKNVTALAEAMERLILRPDLVASMGKYSRKLAAEKYDVRKVNAVVMKTMGLSGNEAYTDVC